MVKRLRHRPLTPVTGVRFPHGSPSNLITLTWGIEPERGLSVKKTAEQFLAQSCEAACPQAEKAAQQISDSPTGHQIFAFTLLQTSWGAPLDHTVGGYGAEDPPVPIPNTVVKLSCAEDTWRAAAWKNRAPPTLRRRGTLLLFFSYIFLNSSVGRACGC